MDRPARRYDSGEDTPAILGKRVELSSIARLYEDASSQAERVDNLLDELFGRLESVRRPVPECDGQARPSRVGDSRVAGQFAYLGDRLESFGDRLAGLIAEVDL